MSKKQAAGLVAPFLILRPVRMTRIERLHATGIRRLGSPKRGFRYVTADGKDGKRPSAADLDRIDRLVLPPAWRDVAISASPSAALQAIGRDAAGRWQYRYSEEHERRREHKKGERLVEFAGALPRMRAAIERDLAHPELDREKVMACILRILSTCFLRPGSEVYAAENGSYGIATLRNRHVTVKGDLIRYDFPGKSGKRQHLEFRDRRVASIIRQLKRMPGKELFKYRDAEGKVVDVKRRHINQYIKEVMGERFTAKDFRTWAGTLLCACALARAGADPSESRTARKKKAVVAIRNTATILGNTPAVCRKSYIASSVLDSFERGRTIEHNFETVEQLVARRRGLHAAERDVLRLLKQIA
ncbi:MAG TPA: DNA topoisomerase IB [Thermoanaerobaculia bacterium]|nr:DNA topoisomerase IB [Thermoanaerobaculia bacterium]